MAFNDAKYAEEGTSISGYSEHGPYHCEDCVHLINGSVCGHPAVINDPAVRKRRDRDGRPFVNIERGCCKYVRQNANHTDNDGDKD